MNKHNSHTNLENQIKHLAGEYNAPHGVKSALRGQVLGQIADLGAPKSGLSWNPSLNWVPVTLATILVITSSTAVMADSAKPGDLLYPVDTVTENITKSLLRDESARAKFHASLAEERVSEFRALEAIDTSDWNDSRKERILYFRNLAQERAAVGLERLNQVQEVVLEKYDATNDSARKDAYLKLSKNLQQVIDRRAEKAELLEEILKDRSNDKKFELKDDIRDQIRRNIRYEFHVDPNKPLDYQFYDDNLYGPWIKTPELRDGDKDGIPDREDQWVPRPLDDNSGNDSLEDLNDDHGSDDDEKDEDETELEHSR
ncbi:MAG: DUF5667 domain-containing protein [Patescibacteria group bacterium]